MQIDHELIRTVGVIVAVIGAGITGTVALFKFFVFMGKMLAEFKGMHSTLKEMKEFQESHAGLMIDTRVRVTGLEKWRDEVIEDSRSGSGIFSKVKK